MRRRAFIAGIAGSTVAWPLVAGAQTLPLIAVLSPLSYAAAVRNIAAFRSGLRDLGYVEGRSVKFAISYADGMPERFVSLAHELVALKPDVIVVGSTAAVFAISSVTRTIPIVGIVAENPIASGFANSIARPGGQITGTWISGDDGLVGKRLEFLQLAVPRLFRVGIILNPDERGDAIAAAEVPAAARNLNMTVQIFEVRDSSQIAQMWNGVTKSDVQALLIGSGPTLNTHRTQITAMANHLRLPASYGLRESAEAGGLMSYGPSLPDIYRQSARFIAKILKGESPAALPIEIPTRYELIVNLKTAKTIGLTIPDSFLLLADEVIE
jgi:putative ABC transport system substrate-binding protein